MATNTFVEFEHPEAVRYASLAGVRNDFNGALRLCNYLSKQMEGGRPHTEIVDAFSTAILIRYFRAFPPGIREWPWREALDSLPSALRKTHEALYHLRGKHVAHSVNALEENRLQARYTLERVEDGITSLGVVSYGVVGLYGHHIDDMKSLCLALSAFVTERMNDEERRLLPLVQAIGVEELQRTARDLDFPRVDTIHVRRPHP